MDHEKRLKRLAEQLIQAIHQAYSDNERIQDTLSRIEEEGYHVDILMASFTRIDETEEFGTPEFDPSELVYREHLLYSGSSFDDFDSLERPGEDAGIDPLQLSPEINDFDKTFLKLIKVSCP
ncbi:MAG: hypothetical protein GXP58_06775 [Deltaproteobacteria bacterium]|nr:hypothetical protein [Deltaproteobacteria bacterium]